MTAHELQNHYVKLENRGFITLAGKDRYEFLQGLVSNDVEKCKQGQAIWTAILTPQGKFLYDFFVFEREEQLVIECDKNQLMELGQLIRKYQLRSEVQMGIDAKSAAYVYFNSSSTKFGDALTVFNDPRHVELGMRIVGPDEDILATMETLGAEASSYEPLENLRISLGIPDGQKDIEQGRGLLLEYGFEELDGVDWDKGCYMGQELTARTKYRALIKKKLVIVEPVSGAWEEKPSSDSEIILNGKSIGNVRSVGDDKALAFVKLDRLFVDGEIINEVELSGQAVKVIAPEWMENGLSIG